MLTYKEWRAPPSWTVPPERLPFHCQPAQKKGCLMIWSTRVC